MLKFRLSDHRGYINNKDRTQATGLHFNLPGHSLADLSITVIEQVKKNDIIYRKKERRFILEYFTLFDRD